MDTDRLHIVMCEKASGVLVPWNTYGSYAEAAMIAARLTEIGCPSRVALMPNQELASDSQAQAGRESD